MVKNEGLLNLTNMSLGLWYKVLLENYITTEVNNNDVRIDKKCKVKRENPHLDWKRIWKLASIKGLESSHYTFLWRMIHNLLPT